MSDIDYADIGFKVFGILVLLIVILFVLTWSGIVGCSQIPYFCDVYETVLGEPRVLIVYGDEGLGNPEELKLLLQSPKNVGATAIDMTHIDRLSQGNLSKYRLVIVEKAKQLSIDQLSMFVDYVNLAGGRLVWIGDAGTQRPDDELENLKDVNNAKLILDNPWARAKEEETKYNVLNFDEFLGLRYVGNYCKEFNCNTKSFSVGIMSPEITYSHPLIYGAHPSLEMRMSPEREMSLVKQFSNLSTSNIVLSLDMGSAKDGIANKFSRYVPLITTSGTGERIAYYAYPLEYFCQDNNYPNACILYVKNMYYGMLGK
ncbi:MAG: hypothetical protein WC915_00135 [archaeon]|jgi:hypothetical protein